MTKVAFLGYGNMAKALAQSFKRINTVQLHAASPSLLVGHVEDQLVIEASNQSCVKAADIVILAVKPAKAKAVLQAIQPVLPPSAILVSVVAGLDLIALQALVSPNQAIVRSMPNMPTAVGQGATAFVANAVVTVSQKKQIDHLFSESGLTIWLDDEQLFHPLTALSGSGPAYVCLFLEALINAGEKLGLDADLAHRLSLQTVLGAVALLQRSGCTPQTLREQVTSKAGTTAAALSVLMEQGFETILYEAMRAAADRSRQLGLDLHKADHHA